MTSFRNFEHSSLPTSLIKQKKRNWARNYMWDFYDFMIMIFHSLTYPKTWGRGPKRLKNTWNWSFLVGFSTPPCWLWSRSKLKSIEHENTFGKLIIPHNSNISCSFTHPKTWEKWLKRLKIPENGHFCRSEHSSLLTSITKQILKPARHATLCGIFIMSFNSN